MALPTADISGFTEEQKKLFQQAASLGSGVQTTDNGVTQTISSQNPITPSSIASTESPYKAPAYTPPPVPDTTGYDKLISDLMAGSPEQTQAQNAQASTLQTIQDTMTRLLGQGEKKAQLEAEKGVLDKQKALNETIAQIRFNNAGAFDASQAQEDRLAPTFAIQGTQAQIERQRAAKNYSLAAVAAVQQDNLALAQDQVQKALDAEFKPLEQVLEYQKLFLEQNRADLERADKKTADKLNLILAERERVLNEAKDNRNTIYSMVTEAAKNHAPNDVINAALSFSNPKDALGVLGQYMSNPFELQKEITDLEYKRALTAKAINEITTSGVSGLDPQQLIAYAQQYATTGQIPTGLPKGTFGVVAQYAKELPYQNGAVVSKISGIKDTKIPAAEQDDLGRLYNIVQLTKQLKELDAQRASGIIGGGVGYVTGDTNQGAYLTLRKSITDEIARMQTGAALTASEQSFYNDYLPGRFSNPFFIGLESQSKIANFENIMEQKLQNALASRQLSIYGYSKVNINGTDYTVGQFVTNANGQQGRVNPDGTITIINQ